jgi:PmbA protein
METPKMLELARQAAATAQKKGAQQVAVTAYRSRDLSVEWRDGRLETLNEATTSGLSLQLYVDGRYSAVSTSDLRPEAIDRFLENAVALARALAKDPFRALPDARLYEGQAQIDLQLEDPDYESVTAPQRRQIAQAIEEAARSAKGAEAIISVMSSCSDSQGESFRVHSNGFEGHRRTTDFWMGASVSVKDPDGRKPEEGDWVGARFFKELPDLATVGRRTTARALARVGAKKAESGLMTVAIDARAGGRFVTQLIGPPLTASALQQKRSMLEGKVGSPIGSALLDVADDPHVVKGFGSQLYDSEGMASRRLPLFEAGVLRNFYVDNYYGRKLGMAPTTARTSNLAFKLGDKPQAQLLADLKDGLFVTGFLGGNSNSTTGDFSVGISGFRVRGGQLAEPIAEMNIAGNHLELWKQLVAVGNDPYPYSPLRTPTLVFQQVQVAGV